MFALIKDGNAIERETLIDLVSPFATFDTTKGLLYINGEKDTISYSSSYTPKEMMKEMAWRAILLLGRQGWRFYKSV